MTQKEFEKLSFEECKSLNGEQETQAVLEAWRAGYIYLQQKLKKCLKQCSTTNLRIRLLNCQMKNLIVSRAGLSMNANGTQIGLVQ